MKLTAIFLSVLLFLFLLIPKFAEGKIFNKDLVSKGVLSTGYKILICPINLSNIPSGESTVPNLTLSELTFFEKSGEFSCTGPEEELLFGEVILHFKPFEGQQPSEGMELIVIYKEEVLRLDSISFDYYEKSQDEPLESKTPGLIYPGLKYLKATTLHKVNPALPLGQETVPETSTIIFYQPNGKMGGMLFTYLGKVYKLSKVEKEVTDIVLVDYSEPITNSPTTDPTANWKTYTNKEYNFTFNYPQTLFYYELKYPKAQASYEFMLLFGSKLTNEQLEGSLTHEWSDFYIGIDRKIHTDQDLNRTGVTEGKLTEDGTILNKYRYEQITINNLTANKITRLSRTELDEDKRTWIKFNKEGYGWTIHYPNIDFEGNHSQIFDQILSTFQFTN